MKFFELFGKYTLFVLSLFKRPERRKVFIKQTIHEMNSIGVGSFGIVSLISVFTGAVSTIQIGVQLIDSLVPGYILGRIVRDSNILEFSPTITCLVLAGKVGSNIASELGTMKVTEQIDALEIMGINSANYLVLPKILAGMITIPLLVTYAMALSIIGGALSGMGSELISIDDYVKGLRADFKAFSISFALIKAFTFAYLITSVSAFHGYRTEGGALEVGQSSTKAVVYSAVAVIIFDYLLSEILLSV
ncbi:MAG: ABC transporter permease [Bacteroidia bacterium]|jgi:phospholipid/cholesterol/gamma-HCH transport system permease protein|nr:ABC transporter permease [Bacteroidia bacterium]